MTIGFLGDLATGVLQETQNPTITLGELYAGDCPPTDPTSRIQLDLGRLRAIARIEIIAQGNLPA